MIQSSKDKGENNPFSILVQLVQQKQQQQDADDDDAEGGGGVSSLFRGWIPRAARAVASGAIQFASYEFTQNVMMQR